MSEIGIVRARTLDAALQNSPRQYLMGDLKRPQELDHLYSDECEVGMVVYPEAAANDPHVHPKITENQYVVSGRVQVMDLHTGDVGEFTTGDFYSVPRGVPHVQKATEGTRIFFFKVPAGNDKVPVQVSDSVKAWMEELDF